MPRQARRIGPSLMHVLEKSDPAHLKQYLEQADANFSVVAALSRKIEIHGEISVKDRMKSALSALSPEDLEPIETECQRVFLLADGKGPDSCPPVLKRHLCGEDFDAWDLLLIST